MGETLTDVYEHFGDGYWQRRWWGGSLMVEIVEYVWTARHFWLWSIRTFLGSYALFYI